LLLTVSKDEWTKFLDHHDATREAVELHMKSRLMGQFSAMNISFFENVSKLRFKELSPQCAVLDMKKGAIVMNQGERGDTFYVIIHGRVGIDVKAGVGGTDAPKFDWSGEKTSGEYFGEIALVMDTPRKATVSCLEDTVLLVINQKTFNLFFEDNHRALAEIQIRLLGERADLHSVLAIPKSLQIFKDFIKAEHSEENIIFWEAAVEFEKMFKKEDTDINVVLEQEGRRLLPQLPEVLDMWDKFLHESADLQVNISAKMRTETETMIELLKKWAAGEDVVMNGTCSRMDLQKAMDAARRRTIFQDSKEEIYKLMGRDTYPRFKKQETYLEFIKDLGLYTTANTANADQLNSKMNSLKNKGAQSPKLDPRLSGGKKHGMGGKFTSSTKDINKGMRKMANRVGSSFGF